MWGRIKTQLLVVAGFALVVLALLFRNRQLKEQADELQEYWETTDRALRADKSRGDIRADVDWLRRRAESGSGARSAESFDRDTREGSGRWDEGRSYSEW